MRHTPNHPSGTTSTDGRPATVTSIDPAEPGARARRARRARRGAVAGMALALTLGTVACSDDGDDEAATDTTEAAAEGGGGLNAAGALSPEVCDAYTGFSGAAFGDPSAATTAVATLADTVPADLAAPVTTIEAALSSGGPEAMGSPEVTEAATVLGDAVYDGCEADARLDVTGVDYGFEGLPAEVDAGRVAIRFTNGTGSSEPHELVLMRRNDGTTEPVEQLLALPQDEVMSRLTPVGVTFADAADTHGVTMADLAPGGYVALCMIPVGGGEQGEPHALHGMVAEFTAT